MSDTLRWSGPTALLVVRDTSNDEVSCSSREAGIGVSEGSEKLHFQRMSAPAGCGVRCHTRGLAVIDPCYGLPSLR